MFNHEWLEMDGERPPGSSSQQGDGQRVHVSEKKLRF